MKNLFTALIFAAIITGCASTPKPAELDNLEKIRFGEQIPQDQDYILVFAAGQEIPLITLVDGDLIEKGVEQRSTVTLKKSIFAYKEWASFDGINWVAGDKIMELMMTLELPGYDNPKPALIHLKLDEKKNSAHLQLNGD